MAATTRTKIHVGGLGQSVSSDDLLKILSNVGTVERLEIVRTKGRSFAYVDVLPSSSNSLSKLFSTYNGCVWKGGKLKLEKAKEHFLTRLKREWAEAEAEAEEARHQPMPSSSDNPNNKTKAYVSQNNHIRIFFPRLLKVKSLPLSGTGKHRYSFQRVETPALPIHFCDCEEHSGQFNAVKQNENEVQQHEEINCAMNEKELSMMTSVMNKLFERGNVSDTSRAVLAKERDNFIKPVEDSLSNEEEDDDDDIIINVVSILNNRASMSENRDQDKISSEKTRLGKNQISKDGAIQSEGKVRKRNTLHPKKKRKPLPNKEDKHELASVSPKQRRNSQFNESEADFEENETDEDNVITNVMSMANKVMPVSGSTKHAKFKSSETQTSEDGSTENELKEEKDLLLPKKKMKPFFAEERDGNEVVSTLPAERGNFQTQSSGSLVVQTTGQESSLKRSSNSCSWSQKSSWRALVGDRSNSAFSLSDILQNVDTTKEKQLISDGPNVNSTPDCKNEKLATSKNLDGMSGNTEIANVLAEAQGNLPNSASNNSGRGSSWLHKSSWMQLVSDKTNSFSISEILPGTTIQELSKPIREDVVHSTDGNIMEWHKTEPKLDASTALGVRKEGDFVQSIPENNHQTVEDKKDASFPAVENICNPEPNRGFGIDTRIGETCSFMRSSASLKEWVKTKNALSRKKKR
ncbi:nucleolar protein 8 isoform X2 [Durio zibethinus]|uniref:Nucleolar protein 8 isoform X2 n=1 Tax=Durio zibethinus TaxID=66656 RepID=A0A6P5ZKT1_DURZI|nr:nucleolar protein 8 isoform X2 [Durio zibethinus]